ncbi:MAG TPA: hypothetical protein VFT56_13855 [Sphingomonas sp.]|nr:hypothetical protein [Sphingomonas sp.]
MRAVLLLIIILIVVALVAHAVLRQYRGRLRQRRRAAWQAKREEEDRIWYEKMGDTAEAVESPAGTPRPLGPARLPHDDEAPSGSR